MIKQIIHIYKIQFTASTILKNMDPDIDPCDDFYRYACGGFLKSTIIPDDKTSINTFSVISDKLQEQLRTSIEAESEPGERKPFRLVKNLYKSCMNKSKFHLIIIQNNYLRHYSWTRTVSLQKSTYEH